MPLPPHHCWVCGRDPGDPSNEVHPWGGGYICASCRQEKLDANLFVLQSAIRPKEHQRPFDKPCAACGKLRLYQEQARVIYCKKCRSLPQNRRDRMRKRLEKEFSRRKKEVVPGGAAPAGEEKREREAERVRENEKLDALELAIDRARERNDPLVSLMQGCYSIWSQGRFEDGSKVRNEQTRINAMKMLENLLGGETGRREVEVNLVRDAYVHCVECGKKFLADPRVSPEDVSSMLGGGDADS